MEKNKTISSLEKLGRTRLSKSFFMREFLYSEISQIERIPNIPDDPELAIQAGENLCQKVLEPIQAALGRISIRSAYRSCQVNEIGNQKGHNCAENEKNYAQHIWDRRDTQGFMGATACVVIPSFIDYYERTGDWTALAWWIHDHIQEYANMTFFPIYAAFNISWHENPNYQKFIYSYVANPHTGKQSGYLTKQGSADFEGTHEAFYQGFMVDLNKP